MTRKIRDFVVTAIGLIVLCGILLSISPDLRERATRMVSDRQFGVVHSAVTHVATSAVETTKGFAGDNTYLFTYLIAGCVFFLLMLKVVL